ncbi:hypothetical protein DMN91_004444 [Ooceraea biroi]|uniref:5'-nucleotidase n=1 Tax=Ooceraea biroi TaxID=2015173 RepID=A0A026W2Z4_OOCBI|nr:7-methylguanosine phosphate-specific 5'-nucleotidase [Ooceraea biroi]EZA50393.1 Cytosolic 5'-nucleotidase [Ooceraea biroi]RLU24234.1 hypothetical protein DMN91_004444 [Ooceraea biroi]
MVGEFGKLVFHRSVIGTFALSRDFTLSVPMKNEYTFDNFPALKLKHVHMKDEVAVLKTINAILQGGRNNLQIVTDFDLTLTKQHIDGKHVLSSFGMFKKSKQLPPRYTDESIRLYHKYRPIEIDPHLSLNEKSNAMFDWMIAAHNLLKGIEFNSLELEEIAQTFDNILRDGTVDVFTKLHTVDVPIVVFSAGLGDMVEAILKFHNVLFDNVKVISNFLKYNGNKLEGFKNDVFIHTFNKNEYALTKDYQEISEERHNVLLMGDTIGDADMTQRIENIKTILKIGFLYERVEESLDSFMEKFDIVLVDDQTMQVPMEILKNIL